MNTETQAAAEALEKAKEQAQRLMSVQPVKIARNVPVAHLVEDAAKRAVTEARGTVRQAEKIDGALGFQVFHQKPIDLPKELVNEIAQLKDVGMKAAKGDAHAKSEFEDLSKKYSHDLAAFLSQDADKRSTDPAQNLRIELNKMHEFVANFRRELRDSGIVDPVAPERSQGYWLYRRLGKIANDIDAIRDNVGKGGVEKRVEELSADYKLITNIYHPAKLALAELKKDGVFENYLKESESSDHSLNKVYALRDLESSTTHLLEALRIMQYAPDEMPKARKEFILSAEDKTTALARLYINENTLAENVRAAGDFHNDPTKQFAFYKDALVAMYDASAHGKGFDQNLASLNSALMQLEVCMAISDKKLFASGEAKLQQNVISNSQKLVANFSSQLAGGPATITDAGAVSAAAKNDSDALYAKIKRARRIDQLAELGASLIPVIGPAFMSASVVKNASRDYAATGEISPMTGLMAATALVGMRAGVAKEAFAVFETSAALKLAEFGVAGAMTVPQVKHMAESWAAYYTAPKNERINRQEALEEAIFNSISLTMPLIAGKVQSKVSKALEERIEQARPIHKVQEAPKATVQRNPMEVLLAGEQLPGGRAASAEELSFAIAMGKDKRYSGAKSEPERAAVAAEYSAIFENSNPEERAVIARRLGMSGTLRNLRQITMDAFYDYHSRNKPQTAQDITALAEQLSNIPERIRDGILGKLEDPFGRNMIDTIEQLILHRGNPGKQEAVIGEWQRAVAVRAQKDYLDNAIMARMQNPDSVRQEDIVLLGENRVKQLAKNAGVPQEDLAAAYDQAYANGRHVGGGRRAVLEKLGIKVNASAATFVGEVFELVVRGRLQKHITEIPGFESAAITEVSNLHGSRGAYNIHVKTPKGERNILVKMENGEPAAFGAKMVRDENLVAPEIYATHEYNTGMRTPDWQLVKDLTTGEPLKQKYYFMESVYDFASGKEVTVTLGKGSGNETVVTAHEGRRVKMAVDGKTEEVTVLSVGLMNDVYEGFDHPSAVTREVWRLARTKEGREGMFKAWRAYHELSRRALLFDRRFANTAVFLVRRADGGISLTFQPIDTDGIGMKIGVDSRTKGANFGSFNNEFGTETYAFIKQLEYASRTAADHGLLGGQIPQMEFIEAALSATAHQGAAMPSTPAPIVNGRAQSYATYTGMIGNGYDSFAADFGSQGTYKNIGGERRILAEPDGRHTANGKRLEEVYRQAQNPQEQSAFVRETDTILDNLRRYIEESR